MSQKKKKAAGGNRTAKKSQNLNHNGNGAKSQRLRLLDVLRKRSMSTLQIRRELDILEVAARIFELREEGHKIITDSRDEETECGKLHNVALYVLLNEEKPHVKEV